MNCVLCQNNKVGDYLITRKSSFHTCQSCGVVFRNPNYYNTPEEERNRYLFHNQDSEDKGYRASVQPLIDKVAKEQLTTSKGLDFGTGTSAIVANMLAEKGFHMQLWDPFFYPDTGVFKTTYHFITCSETIEHFHHPLAEFNKMYALLNPEGILYCKTELLTQTINFEKWYYKNDATHVVFYTEASLKWIQKTVGFRSLEIQKNIISFRK